MLFYLYNLTFVMLICLIFLFFLLFFLLWKSRDQEGNCSFIFYIYIFFLRLEKMKLNEPVGNQKIGRQNSWRYGKHAKLITLQPLKKRRGSRELFGSSVFWTEGEGAGTGVGVGDLNFCVCGVQSQNRFAWTDFFLDFFCVLCFVFCSTQICAAPQYWPQ